MNKVMSHRKPVCSELFEPVKGAALADVSSKRER
jgi:hypothetical protein